MFMICCVVLSSLSVCFHPEGNPLLEGKPFQEAGGGDGRDESRVTSRGGSRGRGRNDARFGAGNSSEEPPPSSTPPATGPPSPAPDQRNGNNTAGGECNITVANWCHLILLL